MDPDQNGTMDFGRLDPDPYRELTHKKSKISEEMCRYFEVLDVRFFRVEGFFYSLDILQLNFEVRFHQIPESGSASSVNVGYGS